MAFGDVEGFVAEAGVGVVAGVGAEEAVSVEDVPQPATTKATRGRIRFITGEIDSHRLDG